MTAGITGRRDQVDLKNQSTPLYGTIQKMNIETYNPQFISSYVVEESVLQTALAASGTTEQS